MERWCVVLSKHTLPRLADQIGVKGSLHTHFYLCRNHFQHNRRLSECVADGCETRQTEVGGGNTVEQEGGEKGREVSVSMYLCGPSV